MGVKRLGRAADHPLPSSAGVENEYNHISASPLCLLGMKRGSLYFIYAGTPIKTGGKRKYSTTRHTPEAERESHLKRFYNETRLITKTKLL
jgi:hypothetical protein